MTGNSEFSDPDPTLRSDPAADAEATLVHGRDTKEADGGALTYATRITTDWAGKRLGKYEVTGVLGRGGMGVVLKAHDDLIDRDVAIKMLPDELSADASSLHRFLAEARAAGKLNHPNVVAIHEVGQQDSRYFLVMELVSGGPVDDRLSQGKPHTPFEATRILIDACQGMAAAHSVSLVHRDIKPSNLLRSHDGRIKVTDFGIVKELTAGHGETRTGSVVGTPYFMSPEQCEGRPVDFRSDIYSLGATYYSLLTGMNPYMDSKSTIQVMYAHCHQAPPDPLLIDPTIPPACRAIVQKAMAKRPEERYQSVQEMLVDLNIVLSALSGGQLAATGTLTGERLAALLSGNQPLQPQVNRRRFLISAGIIGGTVAAGGIGAALWSSRGREKSATPAIAGFTSDSVIKVGIVHSLSGTMASSEMPVVDAVMFAIDEINDAGGILGCRIKPIVADGRSNDDTFANEARRLIEKEKVCTVFGGWTSSSRKSMKPVFEELDHLLVYPVQYEGLESSPNIFYIGATPNQQILPAIDWAQKTLGKHQFFLVGSDYVFPRVAHAIIKDHLPLMGGHLIGEVFLKLGSPHVENVIKQIVDLRPEMILNAINGDTNIPFFRELREAGITPEVIPTLSFSIGENELRNFDLNVMRGDYAACNYFQSIDSAANKAFVGRLQEKYPQRVVTDPMESAYVGVKLWAGAVNEAQNLEPKAIRRALLTQRLLDAPQGSERFDAESQHVYKIPRVGQIRDDGQFDVVWSEKNPVAPHVFPPSRTSEEWKGYLNDLYTNWGNHWSAQ